MEPSEPPPLTAEQQVQLRVESDLARIVKVARQALEREYRSGSTPADFRLDTFVVVPVFAWTEDDGDLPVDMTVVAAESRRLTVQRGTLEMALDDLRAP